MKTFKLITIVYLLLLVKYGQSQTTILLNSTSNWFDTEYNCTSNSEIRLIAYGAHADNPENDNWIYGPGGSININNGNVPLSGIQDNSLIGKVGSNGEPFYIGSGGKYIPSENGRLFIMLNDGNLINNIGNIIVKIFEAPLKTFLLDTRNNWTNTELSLIENHEYFIYATGSHADNPENDNWILSPSGSININNGYVPIPGLQDNCLIGKIGSSDSGFYVGIGGKIVPNNSGNLYLMVNDGNLVNNVGYLIIQIFDNEISTGTASVSYLNSNYSVKTFPNPVENTFSIKVEQLINQLSIEMFDFNGRKIFGDIVMSNTYELNFSSFKNGIYLLILKNEQGELIRTEKIIKK